MLRRIKRGFRVVRGALRFRRNRKRFNRGRVDYDMDKLIEPITEEWYTMKPITQSKTTQNVAAGTAGAGGVLYGAMAFLRTAFPGVIPWSEDTDAAIVVAATAILGPLFSRVIAVIRDPDKA